MSACAEMIMADREVSSPCVTHDESESRRHANLAEIGLVGKAPGQYSLFLGGNSDGSRLNCLTHENVNETQILDILDRWFVAFAASRNVDESFGDFLHRHDLKLAKAD